MSVKPLTVVGKVPKKLLRHDGVELGEMFEHEDCVTLADAERYASEKVIEALASCAPSNHGAFYLETQADLVLKARVEAIEKRLRGMGVMLP